jgi:hypothetical protein
MENLPIALTHEHSPGIVAVRSRYYAGQRGISLATYQIGYTHKRIRSIGSGRLSRTFYHSEYGLIQSDKASMGAAKNSFHYKPLRYHLPPGVRRI